MTPLLYGLALTIGGMVIGFVLRAWAYPVRNNNFEAFEQAYDFGHASGKVDGFDTGYAEGYANGEADHGPAVTLRSAQKGLFQI